MFRKDIKEIRKSVKSLYINSYEKLKHEMHKKLILLKENPQLYQRTEINKEIRRFFIHKYVIFYRIKQDNIELIRILHQKSNYNQKIIYKTKSLKRFLIISKIKK